MCLTCEEKESQEEKAKAKEEEQKEQKEQEISEGSEKGTCDLVKVTRRGRWARCEMGEV